MRLYLLLFLALGCQATPPPKTIPALQPFDSCQDSREVFSPGVLRVRTQGKICSGVVISTTEVLTSAHCVEDDPGEVWVETAGFRFDAVDVAYRGPDEEDIALVTLGDNFISYVEPLPVAEKEPGPGTILQLVGYGCDPNHAAQFMRRVVTKRPLYRGTKELNIEGCACHGDSGSPLFNGSGEVVGVNWTAGFNQIYAISTDLLGDLRKK